MNYASFKQGAKKKLLLTKEGLDNLKKKLDDMTARRHMAVGELRSIREADAEDLNVVLQIQRLESVEKEAVELDMLLRNVEPVIKQGIIEEIATGCTVSLRSSDRLVFYTVVSPLELDIENNKISEDSLLGKALLGKKVGDVLSLTTPKGITISYEVISIT